MMLYNDEYRIKPQSVVRTLINYFIFSIASCSSFVCLSASWLSGKLVGTNYFYYFCIMELFKQLASLMLPSQILDYFDVVKVEEGATLIEISLDETYPESYKADENIESKGFMEPTTITDFPIRDHKLLLHVRRRRWLNRKDGVSFCRPLNLVAEGTCYSKEFAAFLKDTYGEFPSDLPYA